MGFFDKLGQQLNKANESMALGQSKQLPDMIQNYHHTSDDAIREQIARNISNIMRSLKRGAVNGNRECLHLYEQIKSRFSYDFKNMEQQHDVEIIAERE